jgi:hypothetical protein
MCPTREEVPNMAGNPFDKAARYAVKLDPAGFLGWALALAPEGFEFRGWLDTRGVPFPGELDRTGDLVAHLTDPATNLVPWAVPIEFQTEPDPLMFGRLLIYLGHLWIRLKPDPERGSRFRLGPVVVNLTGTGFASRRMEWQQAGFGTTVNVRERNMEDESADETLTGIAAGRWSRGLLPWIPLMTGGDDSGIIDRWKALADGEPDFRRRAEFSGLGKVMAEAAGRGAIWKNALRDWNVQQSEVVNEWKEEARADARAASLIDVLELRFGKLSPELTAAIHDTTASAKLREWIKLAVKVASIDEFRQTAGI